MGKPRDLANVVATGNILADGAVAPAELTGVNATAAEINILDGVTATAAELNLMDGVTATTAELNHVDGVTSNVQTQMDTKAPVADPTFTGTATAPTVNASTALQIGGVAVTATAAELNKMDGVTVSASDINTVTAKAPTASPSFTGDVTVTGDTFTITSSAQDDPVLLIQNTTNDSNSARLKFNKDRGAAAQDGDDIADIIFAGENDAQQAVTYAAVRVEATDVSDGSEDGTIAFQSMKAGTLSDSLKIDSGGDVGIGVSPSNPGWARNVHIHGSSNGGGLKLTDNTSGSGNDDGLDIASYQGIAFIINRENNDIRFHQNDTEKMRLSNGALLIGSTSGTFNGDAKIVLTPNSDSYFINNGQTLSLNRTSSDGAIVGFYKDQTSVGSIGAVNGNIKVSAYGEEYASLSGTSVTIDCRAGNNFALTTSGNTTFTFSNVPTSGTAFGFTLKLTSGGSHTITYPNSVDFAGATAPDAPASGETDVLVFYTVDGGTNWYGALAIDAAG